MSTLRVIKITNKDDDGPVEFTKGAILPANQQIINSDTLQTAIEVSTSTGVVTATSFHGSGIGITGLSGTSTGLALGLIFIG